MRSLLPPAFFTHVLEIIELPAGLRKMLSQARQTYTRATPRTLNVAGLVMSLAGIILMFVFGAPVIARTGGESMLLLEGINASVIRYESFLDVISWVGFMFALVGTVSMIFAELKRAP